MALTHPSRSDDLANLDLDHKKFSPEDVTQQTVKTTDRILAFPGSNPLCSVTTLRAYKAKEKQCVGEHKETRLFIVIIRPFKPATSSTIARWMNSVLTKSGIDTLYTLQQSSAG